MATFVAVFGYPLSSLLLVAVSGTFDSIGSPALRMPRLACPTSSDMCVRSSTNSQVSGSRREAPRTCFRRTQLVSL